MCAQATRTAPCRRPRRPYHAPVSPRALLRAVSQPPRPCRAHSRSYRGTSYAVSQPGRCRIAGRVTTHPRSQASACHDTTDCIVTHSPAARPSPLSGYKTLYRDTHPQPGCRPQKAVFFLLLLLLFYYYFIVF